MKLSDFVSETLKQLFDGVSVAQEYAKSRGGRVNPDNIHELAGPSTLLQLDSSHRRANLIDFDVAVTTSEGTETKGGVGVFVGPVGLGSQGKSAAENLSVSRIKFSIPVVIPNG